MSRRVLSAFLILTATGCIYAQSTLEVISFFTDRDIKPGLSIWITDPFPVLHSSYLTSSSDSLHPRGLLQVQYGKVKITATIDAERQLITLSETIDGTQFKIPFTAPLNWYFERKLIINRRAKLTDILRFDAKEVESSKTKKRGKSVELVGVDLGNIGRASLRVNGNVNIAGKMIFQDQELVRSNINQVQNTHLEFEQKQNLNIEGKIGDRISVKLDQDSERDFDWENNIRISYKGEEDNILKTIDAGNISLSLPSTQYVTFSGKNNGLFGLKSVMQLGPIDITTIASIEQTKKEKEEYSAGSKSSIFTQQDYNWLKDKYFFIHEWFRNGIDTDSIPGFPYGRFIIPSYFPLNEETGLHYTPPVSIKGFELYKSDQANESSAKVGIAYVDTDNPDYEKDKNMNLRFVRLERDVDYTLSALGYLRYENSGYSNVVLGCQYYLVNDANGDTVYTVGYNYDNTDSLHLKMLRPDSPNPEHPVWDLMFKNVYSLGTTGINKEGFKVRIFNDLSSPISDRNNSGVSYIELFGLDKRNENMDLVPDEIIDFNDPGGLVDVIHGEIHFPSFYPFVAHDQPGFEGQGNTNPDLKDELGKGLMYTSPTSTQHREDHVFIIESEYSNTSSSISLGFMVVDGSEEVKIDGIIQKRGIDYRIDYFTGTIILLGDNTKNPNADIEVLFEKHELISFDKKVIIGSRAQMDIGEKSFIGTTALYYNQSIINEKVEVGYEPTRNFIWDINGRFEKDLSFMTRFIDKLPLIETDDPSSFSLEGEIAQVIPNPNPINNKATGDPNGVAFIDDFEGSKRTTNPPIQSRFWKPSSAPIDIRTGEKYSQRNRARMYWYNPYSQVRTKDIWPNQETSLRARNDLTDILIINHRTRSHQSQASRDSIWSGITTSLYSGDYDQTSTKFFEIWLKGNKGDIIIDLGKISEDSNGNGILDTEDELAGGMIYNDRLDDGEDTGLDGCFDPQEDGWGGCLPDTITYSELVESGNTDLINTGNDVNPDDPNGDNWSYRANTNNYLGTVGTEKNGSGSKIAEGGKYPDTEDLNRSLTLDKLNDYFTKKISLVDDTYLAGETISDGVLTGWRLFRIPLSHFVPITGDSISQKSWNEIRNARLVWTGIDSQAVLQIAKIELVGNEWLELGVASDTSSAFTVDDSVFAIAVVNTDDNAFYNPPKGVQGEYDRVNDIRSKEQSLVLKFDNLKGNNRVAAIKTLRIPQGKAKSYLTYDRMKMYVYGNSSVISAEDTKVKFIMRFGLTEDEYYELKQPVYDEWDESENRNTVDLDLNWLTKLKLADSTTVKRFNPGDIFIDSLGVKKYYFTDRDGYLTGKSIIIRGNPALSRIKYITVGVKNMGDVPISGEVWIDELRLSGVKKDKGIAMRLQSKLEFAGIGNATFSYSKKDADFHVLQNRLGSGQTTENFRVNTNFQIHKILPKFLGLKIPVNTAYARITNTPKYFPDTDILAGISPPDSILTKSESVNISTSIAKSTKSDNRLIKYSFDNLSGSFSAAKSIKSTAIIQEELSEKYTGKLTYNLSFGRDHYISPLKWFEPIPLIGEKLSQFHLYYSPSVINTGLNFNETLKQTTPRRGKKRPDNYNLGLTRNFGLTYKFTESITSNYKSNYKSDMDDFRGYAWMAVQELDPGIVTSVSENLNTNINPKIFTWLRPSFGHTAGYSWNKPLNQTWGANIGTNLRFNSQLTLNMKDIMEIFYKPTAKKSGQSRRRRGEQKVSENQEEKKPEKRHPVLKFIHKSISIINPINFTYTSTLNRSVKGVIGTRSKEYSSVPNGWKFGWEPDHNMELSPDITNNEAKNYKQDVTLRSGLKFKKLNINLNYSQNISKTLNGLGVDTRTMGRDYFAFGEILDEGVPFPGWSFRLSGVEKWPVIKLIAKTASIEHAYSGKQNLSWKFEEKIEDELSFAQVKQFIDSYEEWQTSSKKNSSFSPLIGLQLKLPRNISVSIRHNRSKIIDERYTGGVVSLSMNVEESLTASGSYNHRGGFTIPIPFRENFRIDNNMNFTLNYDQSNNEQWKRGDENSSLTQVSFREQWKIGLRISYSFTSKVSGGIVYGYKESDNTSTGKKIDRNFGFDLNLSISG